MRRSLLLVAVLATLGLGCATSRGIIPLGTLSRTDLDGKDFKVVKTGVTGQATCPFVFGWIPVGDPAVATNAMNELVTSASLNNTPSGLVNFSADEVVANYFFIWQVRTVYVRADMVEFTGE
jgi:hypothetical protein